MRRGRAMVLMGCVGFLACASDVVELPGGRSGDGAASPDGAEARFDASPGDGGERRRDARASDGDLDAGTEAIAVVPCTPGLAGLDGYIAGGGSLDGALTVHLVTYFDRAPVAGASVTIEAADGVAQAVTGADGCLRFSAPGLRGPVRLRHRLPSPDYAAFDHVTDVLGHAQVTLVAFRPEQMGMPIGPEPPVMRVSGTVSGWELLPSTTSTDGVPRLSVATVEPLMPWALRRYERAYEPPPAGPKTGYPSYASNQALVGQERFGGVLGPIVDLRDYSLDVFAGWTPALLVRAHQRLAVNDAPTHVGIIRGLDLRAPGPITGVDIALSLSAREGRAVVEGPPAPAWSRTSGRPSIEMFLPGEAAALRVNLPLAGALADAEYVARAEVSDESGLRRAFVRARSRASAFRLGPYPELGSARLRGRTIEVTIPDAAPPDAVAIYARVPGGTLAYRRLGPLPSIPISLDVTSLALSPGDALDVDVQALWFDDFAALDAIWQLDPSGMLEATRGVRWAQTLAAE